MPQRIWALLLLVAFVAARVKLASGGPDAIASSTKSLLKSDSAQRGQLVKAFEKRLLAMFGLSSRPRPRRNFTVSDYMWEIYKKQAELNKGLAGRPATTIRCFRGKEKSNAQDPEASFKFNLEGLPTNETVWRAELVVYQRQTDTLSFQPHRVQVFDIVSPDSALRLVDTRSVREAPRGQWQSFDVSSVLSRWQQDPATNHGLVVRLLTGSASAKQHIRLKREAGETAEQWQQFQPLLVTYSTDSRAATAKRTRRSVRKHRRKGRKNHCSRHALYVDFSDVGWNDWIVAPPGYDAYFCHGDCPFPLADHLNSTNHAIVQTLVNSVNPAAVPRACCVPTELSPISMLYVDEYDKVVLKNYQDMVVEGCGCR